MTKHNIIRILAGLSFLIFFCPFFQMCSDKSMIRKEEAPFVETTVVENTPGSINVEKISAKESKLPTIQPSQNTINKKEEKVEKKKNHALNAYELASVNFKEMDELNFSDIFDSGLLFFSLYAFIILVSGITIISALQKRIKTVFLLSVINLILAISSMLMFVFDPLFDEISQIKFGYYLFILNTLALIIFSKKSKAPDAV